MKPETSLKLRAFRAAGWTVGGYGGSQVMRLLSNLVLTRLLFPEVFGVMAIIQAVLTGVWMLSDIGVSQNIIRSHRAHDERFMNTAWTISIAKGVFVWLVVCILAVPMSIAYKEPVLAAMLPVAGLTAVFGGLATTNGALTVRNIDTRQITLISLGGHLLTILTSIFLAWLYPSPWALVFGNLLGSAVQTVAGHIVFKGPRNRLGWEREAARDIATFGAAVMVSSSLTFFAGEGNRLVAGLMLDLRMLGLLGLSTTLNLVMWSAIQQVSARVLFPAYSEVFRQNDPKRFSAVVERTRRVQVVPAWCLTLLFACFGPWLIGLLYDPRYSDAGIILRIQALGLMMNILSLSYTNVLWAMNKVNLATILMAVQGALQIGGMFIGNLVAGQLGVIVGSAFWGVLMYPVTAYAYARLGLWHKRLDFPVLLASLVAIGAVVLSSDWSAVRHW